MPKQLFKGTFNWYGEVHVIYQRAYHLNHARKALLAALAKKLNITSYTVRQYFGEGANNHKIELEVKLQK